MTETVQHGGAGMDTKPPIQSGVRVTRSAMTGRWYVVTLFRDHGQGRIEAISKREVDPRDAEDLEDAHRCREDWRAGHLVERNYGLDEALNSGDGTYRP